LVRRLIDAEQNRRLPGGTGDFFMRHAMGIKWAVLC
jgi:hypothetical protein